ncbi:hypothetical protein ARMGADRAFT_1037034 [Armillaria gallica]|uniref:Uncharacterized protein n=1 Tax=Armillaria gallica TaxID=47427 RepID=A0A2H3CRQ5_ARMGA|nr:hypothetical protein ARMGADRAFT_1037034 [Armillaria gallica]
MTRQFYIKQDEDEDSSPSDFEEYFSGEWEGTLCAVHGVEQEQDNMVYVDRRTYLNETPPDIALMANRVVHHHNELTRGHSILREGCQDSGMRDIGTLVPVWELPDKNLQPSAYMQHRNVWSRSEEWSTCCYASNTLNVLAYIQTPSPPPDDKRTTVNVGPYDFGITNFPFNDTRLDINVEMGSKDEWSWSYNEWE